MRHKAEQYGLDWVIDSAGTESYHVGEHPHRFSQKICMQHGIDISQQLARRFVAADFEQYDKIYAMAADVREEVASIGGSRAKMSNVDLFLNELHPGSNESVPDPWYGNEDGYTVVYDMIDATCDAIINKYANK